MQSALKNVSSLLPPSIFSLSLSPIHNLKKDLNMPPWMYSTIHLLEIMLCGYQPSSPLYSIHPLRSEAMHLLNNQNLAEPPCFFTVHYLELHRCPLPKHLSASIYKCSTDGFRGNFPPFFLPLPHFPICVNNKHCTTLKKIKICGLFHYYIHIFHNREAEGGGGREGRGEGGEGQISPHALF